MQPELSPKRIPVAPGSSISNDDGLRIMGHPKGFNIYMVKSRPGVFYNIHGDIVSDEAAREAGFPVEKLVKERKRRELMSKAQTEIAAQLDQEFADKPEDEPLMERRGYRLMPHPLGGYRLLDPDGASVLSPTAPPLPEEQAIELFNKVVPETLPAEDAPAGS